MSPYMIPKGEPVVPTRLDTDEDSEEEPEVSEN